jgi:hypothetical protein
VTADLCAVHSAAALVRAGQAQLDDPAADAAALAQGAVDLLRGVALYNTVNGACGVAIDGAHALRTAMGAGNGGTVEEGELDGELEQELLLSVLLVNAAFQRVGACSQIGGGTRAGRAARRRLRHRRCCCPPPRGAAAVHRRLLGRARARRGARGAPRGARRRARRARGRRRARRDVTRS